MKKYSSLPKALREMIKYGLVSIAALAVDFGLLVLLTELFNMHYIVSATISFAAGVVVNYELSLRYVFDTRKINKKHHEFIIFCFIGIVGLILNDVILFLATDKLGVYYILSKVVATVIVFFWNFIMRKIFLF